VTNLLNDYIKHKELLSDGRINVWMLSFLYRDV